MNRIDQQVTPISDEEVDRAGRTLLLELDVQNRDREEALLIINQWRAKHSVPLNTLRINLRRRAGKSGFAAQRLKRLPSIVSKLQRLPRLRLSEIQDIGGCRVVVPTADDAFTVASDLMESRIRHELIRHSNYIEKPRPTGYRGLHLVYAYNSDRTTAWQGLKTEIQFRSELQHQWATAVETVGTFIRDDLKSGIGNPTWLRFFALMSSAIALREDAPLVPGTPGERRQLFEEIRTCDQSLGITDRLRTFQVATQGLSRFPNFRNRLVVLKLDLETQFVDGWAFPASESEQANALYLEKEQETQGNVSSEVVLVATDSLAALRRAYPNYFLDINSFRKFVIETVQQS